jgi:hypothetical protein
MKYILCLVLAIASITAVGQDNKPVRCEATLSTTNTQCTAIAKITTPDGKHYCTRHNPDKPKCKAITKKGLPCQNAPVKGGDKCSKHYFQETA